MGDNVDSFQDTYPEIFQARPPPNLSTHQNFDTIGDAVLAAATADDGLQLALECATDVLGLFPTMLQILTD